MGIVLLLLVLSPIWYGVRYHTLAFWAPPPRIPYCDRVYQLSGEPATAQSLGMTSPDPAEDGLSSIGHVIPVVGYPIWARVTPEGAPCTTAIYVETAPGLYQAYGLAGGP